MSADSTSPTDPDLTQHPPTTEGIGAPPPLKKRYKKPEASLAGGGMEDSDEEIIVLSSLLQNLLARKQNAQASETEGDIRAKVNRFGPRNAPVGTVGTPAFPFVPPVVSVPEEPPVAPTAPPPPRSTPNSAEAMAAIAFPKFEPRSFQAEIPPDQWQRNGTWGLRVLYFAFAAALALGAFLVGRGEGRRTPAPAPAPASTQGTLATWPASFSGDLDRVLTTDRSGDLEAAHRAAETLQANMGKNPVLTTYLAMLETRIGRTNDVEADLSRAISRNAPPAAVAMFNEAQGFNYARRREFDHAADCFAITAQIQPFGITNLLHLAESQRRAGRLTEAIDTFQQTLLRLPSGAQEAADLREYLAFKQHLSQIEIGREEDFKTEMDRQLAVARVSPYWMLTAAAVALQKNDLPTGIGFLQKAQAALPSARFATLMNDYFFRSFIHHAEVVPFLTVLSAEQQQARRTSMDFFIDP